MVDITSLAAASFVVDVNRSFLSASSDVHADTPDKRKRNFSAYPRCDHRVWLISFFCNYLG